MKLYTDTNVMHYLGDAFSEERLPDDISVELLISPLTLMELLSHLGGDLGPKAFNAIHAIPNIHDAKATGVLPFSDDFFRMAIFNLPPGDDVITPALNRAINNVLTANDADEVRADGAEMRTLLEREKHREAQNFGTLLQSLRAEGPLSEGDNRLIFARSIAQRAGVAATSIDADQIVSALDAHYRFERERMQVGVAAPNYNVQKHRNDIFDAELLIYLADPSLHFLTADAGFRRAQDSAQFSRIYLRSHTALSTRESATNTLRTLASPKEA